MQPTTPLDDANNLIVRRFIRQYLSPEIASIRSVEHACVTITRIGNRYGVVPDAATYRYVITHPELGFAFDVRAVWRCGDLLRPLAVHTVIGDYEDLGQHGCDHAVRVAANDWLQSLPV